MSETIHPLAGVLAEALARVTDGKGAERHGRDWRGRPLAFADQPLMTIGRAQGPGFGLGQVQKKVNEVPGLLRAGRRAAARAELLDAIAYAAGVILLLDEGDWE